MDPRPEDQQAISNNAAVMKELSDIKSSLAVNTEKTGNMSASITEIKADIKEIKSDFVSRREFNEALKAVRDEVAPLKKVVYGFIALVLVAVVGAWLSGIIK